jgi:hypothetical protein
VNRIGSARTPSSTPRVSLFQTNSIALRATRRVNWVALGYSVILLTDVDYRGSGSPQ